MHIISDKSHYLVVTRLRDLVVAMILVVEAKFALISVFIISSESKILIFTFLSVIYINL